MTTPATGAVVNEGLFWRETAALRKHLHNKILLPSSRYPDGQPVPAIYALPDDDVRRRQFPYVMVDFITTRREMDREHRGRWYANTDVAMGYRPDGYDPATTQPVAAELPIPLSLVFQVSGWTRNRQHQIVMLARFTTLLPFRFGAVDMVDDKHARDDNTTRRLDLLSGPDTSDEIEPGQADASKRIYRVIATVAVSSEILPSDFNKLSVVERVVIDPASRPGYSSIVD